MAVVGSGHKYVLGGILRYIFDIVGAAVAGNIETVSLEKVVRQLAPFGAPLDVFEHPGNPLRRCFDESEAQLGKYFRQLAGNYGVARARGVCRHTPEAGAVADALTRNIQARRVAIADMHADRQILLRHRFVERKKIRILDQAIAFERTHQHGNRAILLAPRQHVDGVLYAQQRQHADPAQPAFPLFPHIYHPAVVGFADRHFELGLVGDLLDEDRWIHHLNIYAHLVHVADARRDVFKMLRFLRYDHVPAAGLCQRLKVLGLDDVADVAANLAVDEPKLTIGLGARIQKDGHELALRRIAILPSLRAFHHVGIDVNRWHRNTSYETNTYVANDFPPRLLPTG